MAELYVLPLFLGGISIWEVLLIVLVILLFVGGKKIPELMKGLGKGVKSFKEGLNEDQATGKSGKELPEDADEEKKQEKK